VAVRLEASWNLPISDQGYLFEIGRGRPCRALYHDDFDQHEESSGRASPGSTAEGGCPEMIYNHPLVLAILAASTRLPAPSLLMASER
jgi:hypothetical protein